MTISTRGLFVKTESDSTIATRLPSYTIVSASAGSGKTTELTRRMVYFLLSRRIPRNRMQHILAITFTNNAALEMKRRVFQLLKKASLGDETILEDLASVLGRTTHDLQSETGRLVDQLLEEHSDFQVQTIDSFLARVFGASAIEFGFTPGYKILLASDLFLDKAVEQFSYDMLPGTEKWKIVQELLALIQEGRASDKKYIWNPYDDLRYQIKKVYRAVIQHPGLLTATDYSRHIQKESENLVRLVRDLDTLIDEREIQKHSNFVKFADAARRGDTDYLVSHVMPDPPVIKKNVKEDVHRRWSEKTSSLTRDIIQAVRTLQNLQAYQHYHPYVQAYLMLRQDIEAIRREHAEVDIGEVAKRLADYMTVDLVPELYFKLGDEISHYLIDEFQDTSPIQWQVLKPLIENSLAQGGSLFVVGDTKQSIYTFRGADWRIMKSLMDENSFPMASKQLRELNTNYRSGEQIVRFSKDVFHSVVPGKVRSGAEQASGLSTYAQDPAEWQRNRGYAETVVFEQDDRKPEYSRIVEILKDCYRRGCAYHDMAILTARNRDVVQISAVLNENDIQFISHSSLDIRKRRIIAEVTALLRFLDSPVDNLSFATFLLSDVFGALVSSDTSAGPNLTFHQFVFSRRASTSSNEMLYVAFRKAYPDLWSRYFEEPFRLVGYLPIYDLVSELFKLMRVFELNGEEEAALVKFLDVVHTFESAGGNSLKDFLEFSERNSEDDDWNINVPSDADAVQVMTIHKAKGLGFRVVIVLMYDANPQRDSMYVHSGEEGVTLLRLTKSNEDIEGLSELYAGKRLREEVDQLNKLYVALTRAKEELYVLSVKSDRAKYPSEYLPKTGYEPRTEKPRFKTGRIVSPVAAPIYHHNQRRVEQPTEAGIASAEAARGEFVHNVLARIEFLEHDFRKQVTDAISGERLMTRQSMTPDGVESTQQEDRSTASLILEYFANPTVREFFLQQEERTILNECEFADRGGALFRMDRVVVDPTVISVIDYKTGDESSAHGDQVSRYMEILGQIYPGRTIKGYLAYIDKHVFTEVKPAQER